MMASIRDLKRSLKNPKVLLAQVLLILVSYGAIEVFGFQIWKRFPVPIMVVITALIWRSIARIINEPQLSHIVRLMWFGLLSFALTALAAASIDSIFFPEEGYFGFTVNSLMWGWMAFQSYRGWSCLSVMSPEAKNKITGSTTVIIAEMHAVRKQNDVVIKESGRVLKKSQLQFG